MTRAEKNEVKVSGYREYRQLDENFCNEEEQRNEVIARGEFLVEKMFFFLRQKIAQCILLLIKKNK